MQINNSGNWGGGGVVSQRGGAGVIDKVEMGTQRDSLEHVPANQFTPV